MTSVLMEEYKEYLSLLYHRIPEYVFEGEVSVFIVGVVVITVFAGLSRGWRKIATLALIEYVIIIYSSTVIFRVKSKDVKLNFKFLDGYSGIYTDSSIHIPPEMLMNILVFLPLGILIGLSIKKINWISALASGFCISLSIEILQYILKRGTTEIDDIFHNTLGCMIGYGLYKLIAILVIMHCSKNNIIK